MPKKLSVSELLKKFDFKVYNKGKPGRRYITSPGIARIGIELTTNIEPAYKKQTNPVCFGGSELNYFIKCSPAEWKRAVKRVKKLSPPIIILNSSFKAEEIRKVVKDFGKTDITIAHINMPTSDINSVMSPWIAKKIAPTSTVHGTLMSIYGIGVLITGDSGTGKSEAAMELLKTGHMFIGDDAIEVYNYGQAVYGHPSKVAKQFIEVRGLGILDVSRMFGWQQTLQETRIHMMVHLVNPESSQKNLNNFERLGATQQKEKLRGVSIPKYYIPVTVGRPTASLIESAVVDLKLKKAGYNSAETYLENYDKVISKGGK